MKNKEFFIFLLKMSDDLNDTFTTLIMAFTSENFSFPVKSLDTLTLNFLLSLANSYYEDDPEIQTFLKSYVNIMMSNNDEIKMQTRELIFGQE